VLQRGSALLPGEGGNRQSPRLFSRGYAGHEGHRLPSLSIARYNPPQVSDLPFLLRLNKHPGISLPFLWVLGRAGFPFPR